jgi:SAM-dependent methyltransferase
MTDPRSPLASRSADELEWLDRPDLAAEDRRRGIADLRRVNRFLFGYHSAVGAALGELAAAPVPRGARGAPECWLDVAAGAGDTGAAVVAAARRRGIELELVSLDREIAHLALGRRHGDVRAAVVADASALPFRDRSFALALSTLFFHHLDDAGKAEIAGEMLRVARRGAVIVDLVHSRWASLALRLLFPLLGIGRIAREDGLVSLARASTFPEWQAFAAARGGRARRWFPSRVAIALRRG